MPHVHPLASTTFAGLGASPTSPWTTLDRLAWCSVVPSQTIHGPLYTTVCHSMSPPHPSNNLFFLQGDKVEAVFTQQYQLHGQSPPRPAGEALPPLQLLEALALRSKICHMHIGHGLQHNPRTGAAAQFVLN